MTEFFAVLFLSIAMFIGCMVAGWIPLAFTLSSRKIQLFTIFGAGLLVGTALAVIIPEGVDAMYHTHAPEKSTLEFIKTKEVLVEGQDKKPIISPENKDVDFADSNVHQHHSTEAHQAIGIALLLGFVFMLLVDQIGGASHSHAPDNIRLDELNQSKVGMARAQQSDQKSKGHTATIGLVVHAAADGIALGAAASTQRQDLQLIVFFAIMLHKAPAAFGLVSFLVHEGLELRKIKRHLLIFALAAPLLAMLTFILLHNNDRILHSEVNTTGLAMLFSAGTFLYVATVHVLPEISHSNGNNKGLSLVDVAVLVIGCLLPLVLNIGHSHHS